MTVSASSEHHARGILLIIAAVSTFAVLDTISKYLARTYPVPLIVWVRYTTHVLIMLVFVAPRLRWRLIASARPLLQIFRGVVLAVSSLLYVAALAFMPIAEASAITFLAPLLMTAMSAYFLRERVRTSAWIALAAGFVGVLFIVRPGGAVFSPAALLAFGAALCFATYQLLTRPLAGVDSTMATLFIGALVGTIVVTFVLPFYWGLPQTPFHALLFVALGAFGAGGHFVLIRAFEFAPPSVLAPFVYAQLATVLVLGYTVFGDFPDGWSLVGMAIIVLSGAWSAARQGR